MKSLEPKLGRFTLTERSAYFVQEKARQRDLGQRRTSFAAGRPKRALQPASLCSSAPNTRQLFFLKAANPITNPQISKLSHDPCASRMPPTPSIDLHTALTHGCTRRCSVDTDRATGMAKGGRTRASDSHHTCLANHSVHLSKLAPFPPFCNAAIKTHETFVLMVCF